MPRKELINLFALNVFFFFYALRKKESNFGTGINLVHEGALHFRVK